VILESNLQADVTPEMFQEGFRITVESCNSTGEKLPDIAMEPISLAAGTSTILLAALDPVIASKDYITSRNLLYQLTYIVIS
jgi:hypothetical protein